MTMGYLWKQKEFNGRVYELGLLIPLSQLIVRIKDIRIGMLRL